MDNFTCLFVYSFYTLICYSCQPIESDTSGACPGNLGENTPSLNGARDNHALEAESDDEIIQNAL